MSSEPGFASLGPTLLARKGGAKPAMRPQVAPLVADQDLVPEEALEDLGWNDMGHDDGPDADNGADIVPINADVTADGYVPGASPVVRRQQRRLEERVLADAAMTGPQDLEAEYDEDGDEDEDEDYSEAAIYGAAAYPEEDYADDEIEDEGEDYDTGAIYSPLDPPAPVVQPVAARVKAPAPTTAKTRTPAVQAGRRAAFTLRLDADRHLKLRLAATMQGVSAQALVTEALDRLLAEYDDLDIIANHLKRH